MQPSIKQAHAAGVQAAFEKFATRTKASTLTLRPQGAPDAFAELPSMLAGAHIPYTEGQQTYQVPDEYKGRLEALHAAMGLHKMSFVGGPASRGMKLGPPQRGGWGAPPEEKPMTPEEKFIGTVRSLAGR